MMPLHVSSVATESDVELNIIWPLLTQPSYLGISSESVKSKQYLAPAELDKAAGKRGGYYPDFSVWEAGFAILIVEAKEPGVPIEHGYREGCLYARHLNSEYKSNVNPCNFVLSCNGTELAYGTWDSGEYHCVKIAELLVGSIALEDLKAFCGRQALLAHSSKCLSAVKLSQFTQPHVHAGGQALINSKKAFNSFAVDLAPIMRRYFTSTNQNNDIEIYKNAYVGNDEITQYDRVLESLLKDRLVARRSLLEELSPTKANEPKLAKAISSYLVERPADGQLQLITGGVGTGKSLFARRYKELLQTAEEQYTRWVFVNFNNAPEPIANSQRWLCEQFISSFHQENPHFDPHDPENLTRIFSRDLQKRRAIYEEAKKKISVEHSEKMRLDDLQSWQQNPQQVAFGICNHFVGERRDVLVVVMDNVDRLDLDSQLGAFSLSLWFLDQSKAFVILQMRDDTYERFKNKKPLDTYKSGVVFHISPPRFLDVVKRRLELSLDYLAANTSETLEYHLDSGIRIVYPKSMLGEFLKSIYLELFEKRPNISRILQALAGRNIREALEMFVSILYSGHLREEVITSNSIGAGGISLPEYRVLRILMRTEYRFFSNNSGFVANIFYLDEAWRQPNNFIVPDILFWLADNRKRRGEIGLEGYFALETIAGELQKRGYIREDVRDACSWLLHNELIEADHMNRVAVDYKDSLKITAAGFIHLRILCERLEYLYGILTVTPISDRDTALKIADCIKTENRTGSISAYQQLRAVEAFLSYLKAQFVYLKSAYPDFGDERSGAAFVIRQLESSIRFFRNPSEPNFESNMLDN